jgi:purine-binding chemotaxis protein CheW
MEKTNQFLTFRLMNEQYALDVSQVQEVLEFQDITHIPGMPSYMRGVINIRGRVVPVVDLRVKLGLQTRETLDDTSIIVIEIHHNQMTDLEDKGFSGVDHSSIITVGCLADSVQEVTTLESDSMEPPPKMGTSIKSQWIHAIAKRENGFVIILDVDKIFSYQELAQVAEG